MGKKARSLSFALASLECISCMHIGRNTFQIKPAIPEYQLKAPDHKQTPFSEVLRGYNGYMPGLDWIDIKPGMELHIEDAFYKTGMPRSGLAGFLGTETAQYALPRHKSGLQLRYVHPMQNRPRDQAPVEQLISAGQQRHHYFRFYNEVFFRTEQGRSKGSVLLGADTEEQLGRLIPKMESDPAGVCSQKSDICSVFPEACSVAVEIEIEVNNKPQVVPWTSSLATVVQASHNFTLNRLYHGRLIRVVMPKDDADAQRLPLLPGDHVIVR